MHSRTADKWTGFWLSAFVPGAGQLAARSWWCLAWFIAAALFAAAMMQTRKLLGDSSSTWFWLMQASGSAALSLACAEHAKRLGERRATRKSAVQAARVVCRGCTGRQIDIGISLEVAQSRAELWKLVGDLPRFLTIDPFHDAITLMRDKPAAGVDLVLSHNAFGRRFLRFGRIVAWREGSGYTFSDLSPRGPRVGFPHVFIVQVDALESRDAPLSRLTVRIRGRWTSRLIPVWLGRFWVRMVCREHARLLRKAL